MTQEQQQIEEKLGPWKTYQAKPLRVQAARVTAPMTLYMGDGLFGDRHSVELDESHYVLRGDPGSPPRGYVRADHFETTYAEVASPEPVEDPLYGEGPPV